MGKRSKYPSEPPDMSQAQQARGYRGNSADTNHSDITDPKGEAAYQKAFAEAAKMRPPRVPNALFYTNSPSAIEFIKKRDREIFSNNDLSSHREKIKTNLGWKFVSDEHRTAREVTQSPGEHQSHRRDQKDGYFVPKESDSMYRHSSTTESRARHAIHPPPVLMEPQFGLPGPARKLF